MQVSGCRDYPSDAQKIILSEQTPTPGLIDQLGEYFDNLSKLKFHNVSANLDDITRALKGNMLNLSLSRLQLPDVKFRLYGLMTDFHMRDLITCFQQCVYQEKGSLVLGIGKTDLTKAKFKNADKITHLVLVDWDLQVSEVRDIARLFPNLKCVAFYGQDPSQDTTNELKRRLFIEVASVAPRSLSKKHHVVEEDFEFEEVVESSQDRQRSPSFDDEEMKAATMASLEPTSVVRRPSWRPRSLSEGESSRPVLYPAPSFSEERNIRKAIDASLEDIKPVVVDFDEEMPSVSTQTIQSDLFERRRLLQMLVSAVVAMWISTLFQSTQE
jgi:hypothetical protein